MKHVLVTGSNGHVGYNLVKELLGHGYEVRASVRDPEDTAKTKHLRDLGVHLVRADVMQPETLRGAMEGVDGVFQVAAVFQFHAKDPEREIIEPSVLGAKNVLEAAHAAGVKKVVFTSSTMAVGSEAPRDRALDERDWNDKAIEPYMIAKTRGERTAWEVAKRTGIDLVVVNPTGVIGPGFFRHTPNTWVFELVLRGLVPALPPFSYSHVDVRDVAVGHRLAYEDKNANGPLHPRRRAPDDARSDGCHQASRPYGQGSSHRDPELAHGRRHPVRCAEAQGPWHPPDAHPRDGRGARREGAAREQRAGPPGARLDATRV
jgi:dihydroflavonol-4-reductase